ncbi:conjugal transfer protein, partial [Kurthia sp. 3B1D]
MFGPKKKPIDDYVFDDEPKTLDKGKQSLQDMSLIEAQYNDFLVTKRGYLVVLLKVTGINLDLLTTTEQEDVFDEFNAFLMSTLGENSEEVQQYLDITMPVDFSEYILFWQHRYLTVLEEEPENEAKLALIASYVDTFSGVASSQEITTKTHIVVLHEKIPKKHLASLEQTAIHLEEKVLLFIRQLEN